MRSEKEMYDLILEVALNDERIRAVYLNGSRTNPNVPKDQFQDFDIVYVVTNVQSFYEDKKWINIFGDLIIKQEPDNMKLFGDTPNLECRYAYLMQFVDGNRIDLTLINQKYGLDNYLSDKLTLPLLDKDHILPSIPAPSDIDYHVKKMDEELFRNCCNEFWWVNPYVAKGLWRNEILYAIDHLNLYVRPMLLQMLDWHVGIITNFSLSVGKCHKYLDKYLPHDLWDMLLQTYPTSNPDSIWSALFIMDDLFRITSNFVASHFNFTYNQDEDNKVTTYLKIIRKLSKQKNNS